MKKRVLPILFILCALLLSACGTAEKAEHGRLQIVSTIYPPYDFVRQIAGDFCDVSVLLKPGADPHDYEPTPSDILKIRGSDLFLYIGGESDEWVRRILASSQTEISSLALIDSVETLMTEHTEEEHGHEGAEEEHDHTEEDEHIWTSPKNAVLMVQAICDRLCEAAPEHADAFRANAETYLESLQALDEAYTEVLAQAKRKTVVFAGRFPFLYLAHDYGLTYHAAFSGCSNETDPSPATLVALIRIIREEQIPVVFYPEFTSTQIPNMIAEETGAQPLMMHSCHTVSAEDLQNGVSYLDLMTANLEKLKTALQ